MVTPIRPTRKTTGRTRRWIGYACIASVWAALVGLLFFFGLAYAIYRDLRAPDRSAIVAGTRFEAIAERVFEQRFCPVWQADPMCAQFDPVLVYVPRPGIAHFRGVEFDTQITMTPEGLRQQPGSVDADQRGPIVLTGDSFAMGWGVNDHETYSAVLARRFQQPTLNAGVSSYGTARELLRLQRLGLLRRARMLVIQFCPNDAAENRQFLAGRSGPRKPEMVWDAIQSGRGNATADVSYGGVLGALLGIVRNSVEQNTLWRRSTEFARGDLAPPTSESRHRRGLADDFLSVLDRFPELADKPIIVIELKLFHEVSNFLPRLGELARDRPNLHVLPVNLSREDFYRFDNHLRPVGHEKVAEQLDRAIRALP